MANDTVLALAPGDDFRYAAEWSPLGDERLTFLLVGKEGARLVIASVNAEEAVAHLPDGFSIARFSDDEGPVTALKDAVKNFHGSRFLVSDDARFAHAQILADVVEGSLGLASTMMAELRMQKDEEEIRLLAESQRINDLAMQAGYEAMRPGMTELELADVVRRAFIAHGADREAFIIVAAGAHSALPHHTPTDTKLEEGPVLFDIGCYYHGYASDMTRVAYLGTPSQKFRQVHQLVEQAVQSAHRTARPGVPAEEVDRAARRVIDQGGYGPQFVHRVGHGIGLSVHEPPSVMEGNTLPLPVNAAFSIEPGIYLPGEFGVRLEEVVVNRPGGAQILSQVPRDIFVKSLK
nr:M24 family metallopeptidase [Sulfobacillus harzensis]